MANLSYTEKRILETFIDMGQGKGYVLNFSDRTFGEFVGDATGIDIDAEKYKEAGTSKANRLRTFCRIENETIVGKFFKNLYEYKVSEYKRLEKEISAEFEEFYKIVERLLSGKIIESIDAIQANNDDKDFHQLARLIKESIENNQPEAALDRLHVFLIKFLKELCNSHGVDFAKEETVNALFGKYIKAIRAKNLIKSSMGEKIIQFSFQIMDAFNDIRNNNSFAHDNPVLNYDESILIFSNVTATVKFIQAMETKHKNAAVEEAIPNWGQFES